jgi:hypothetical protein
MKDCWATKADFRPQKYDAGYRKGTASACKMDGGDVARSRSLATAHIKAAAHHGEMREKHNRGTKAANAHKAAEAAHRTAAWAHINVEMERGGKSGPALAHATTGIAAEASRETGGESGWDEGKHPRDENGKFA